ncbi:MAG: glutamate-1-semialdehyde-2,1-aminomutase [Gemmatimonadetes bacterium]|nr:glutamate-1-semialdehyde-2,1-aminomutase [Gemmatimonadota bacterium]
MIHDSSRGLLAEAEKCLVGGVNSPVRAFRSVGGSPPFIDRGEGSRVFDVDGNEYIDLVGSWGPLILGHAHPAVVETIVKTAGRGTSFGAPCRQELELARMVVSLVPSVEKVRFVCSGTEATMSALRLARAATGRTKIVKMAGHYHGHGDSFLVSAGSGALTLGTPDSPGVPPGLAAETIVVPFNDAAAVEQVLREHEIACVILEPIAGNMGVVPPAPGYLQRLRGATLAAGAVLIFDEVMTGFRVGPGGAQERYDVVPDLTTMGKVIGGGLPVGAYGGPAALMDQVAPSGPVYQAGTLAGNPLAMAAGAVTLSLLADGEIFERLELLGSRLEDGLKTTASAGAGLRVQRVGSMLTLFFTEDEVNNLESATAADHERFGRYHAAMLQAGIYLPPSGYEAWFLSAAHGEADVDRIVEAHRKALDQT